jgi:hypothetical protein
MLINPIKAVLVTNRFFSHHKDQVIFEGVDDLKWVMASKVSMNLLQQ